MPFYDYKCGSCVKVFEVIRGMNDNKDDVICPTCGKIAQRVFTPIKMMGAEHKGSGCSSCSDGVCSSCSCKN